VGSRPILDEATGQWTSEFEFDGLGADVAMLDNDGDGRTDFASSIQNGTPGEITEDSATYLWFGPASGTGTAALADTRIYGEDSVGGLVGVTASAGDLDGDGDEELLVGGRRLKGPDANYGLFVFEGPAMGTIVQGDADAMISDGLDWSGFGMTYRGIAHTDLDGDGRDDVIASDADFDTEKGVAYVFHGDSVMTGALPDAAIYGTVTNGRFGCSVAEIGDIDGDALGDLAIGACTDSGGASYAGSVFLMYGPFTGSMNVSVDRQAELYGDTAGGNAGWALAAGDVTGDAIVDLIVGVPGDVGGKAIIVPSWNL